MNGGSPRRLGYHDGTLFCSRLCLLWQTLQRFGDWLNPFSSKYSCAWTVKTNSSPQSTQIKMRCFRPFSPNMYPSLSTCAPASELRLSPVDRDGQRIRCASAMMPEPTNYIETLTYLTQSMDPVNTLHRRRNTASGQSTRNTTAIAQTQSCSLLPKLSSAWGDGPDNTISS